MANQLAAYLKFLTNTLSLDSSMFTHFFLQTRIKKKYTKYIIIYFNDTCCNRSYKTSKPWRSPSCSRSPSFPTMHAEAEDYFSFYPYSPQLSAPGNLLPRCSRICIIYRGKWRETFTAYDCTGYRSDSSTIRYKQWNISPFLLFLAFSFYQKRYERLVYYVGRKHTEKWEIGAKRGRISDRQSSVNCT